MRVLRLALLVLALFAAPLAVFGFWANHALDDDQGYADAMVQAWKDPDVRADVESRVTETATEKVYEYFNVSGPGQNPTADLALTFATGTIEGTLPSTDFLAAWRDWHLELHQDLAQIARGGDPEKTSVDGHTVTVDVEPLIAPFFDSFIGRIALQAIDTDDLVMQLQTQEDVEAQLHGLGWLAAHRWWFAAALAALLTAGAAAWTSRARGVGLVLMAGAAGCLVSIPLRFAYSAITTGDETALGRAVSDALSRGSVLWPFVAALLFGAAGLALARTRRMAAPQSAPAPQTA